MNALYAKYLLRVFKFHSNADKKNLNKLAWHFVYDVLTLNLKCYLTSNHLHISINFF